MPGSSPESLDARLGEGQGGAARPTFVPGATDLRTATVVFHWQETKVVTHVRKEGKDVTALNDHRYMYLLRPQQTNQQLFTLTQQMMISNNMFSEQDISARYRVKATLLIHIQVPPSRPLMV